MFWLLVLALVIVASPGPPALQSAAQEHLQRGLDHARSGDLKSAETQLRLAAGLAPNDAEILAALGGVLGLEQKLDEAVTYLARALQLSPRDLVVRRNLATNQWQRGRLQEAKRNLQQVLETDSGDQQAVLLLGIVSENLADYSTALKLLESVPALVRARPISGAAMASSYYHTGRPEKARRVLDEISSAPPEVVFTGARVAADAKDYEIAEKMFSSIRTSYTDSATLTFNIALAQYHRGHFVDCENTLAQLTGGGRAGADAYNLLGWCAQKQGKEIEAIAALEQAIGREPGKESNYLDLCTILIADNRLPAALEMATRTVQVFPASSEAWSVKGSVQTRMQHFLDAVATFGRAVQLNSGDVEARRALATVQWSAGLVPAAAENFNELIRRDPRDARTYGAYGALLVSTAENEGAVTRGERSLERAIELDPSLAEPHYYLGNLALTRGKISEALRQLEEGVRLNPSISKMHFALSRVLKRQGKLDESAREFAAYQQLKAAEMRANPRYLSMGVPLPQ
jgi:superkiller protein 3